MPSATVLATFDEPTAARPTRIAVPADLHLTVDASGTWRVSHRTPDRLKAAVAAWNEEALDAVVFIGDLVNDGTQTQFEAFDEIIADLEHPFYAIPGNHDLIARDDVASMSLTGFENRYGAEEFPYHRRIGGVDLVALNSNQSTHSTVTSTYAGAVSEETLGWLRSTLPELEHPLVTIHHNLPGVRGLHDRAVQALEVSGGSPGFENAAALQSVLRAAGGPLVVTGHLHFPAVITDGAVTEFTLPSLGPYPCGYTILDIDEQGTVATFHSVANLDDRIEAFVHATEHTRAQLAAAQFVGLPLRDERGNPAG